MIYYDDNNTHDRDGVLAVSRTLAVQVSVLDCTCSWLDFPCYVAQSSEQ